MTALTYQLVTGNQDMEGSILVVADFLLAPELAQSSAVLWIAPVRKRLELGHKASNFLLPIVQSRRRRDHQEGAPDVVRLRKVRQQ